MTTVSLEVRANAKSPKFFATLLSALLLMYPFFGQLLPGEVGIMSFGLGVFILTVWFIGERGWMKVRPGPAGAWWLLLALYAAASYFFLTTVPTQTVTVLFLTITCMVVLSIGTAWIRPALRVVLAFTSVHAIATILFYAVPSLYFGVFKPRFFPGVMMADGYQAGLTSHYSYNAMYCAVGVLIAGAMALFDAQSIKAKWGSWALSGMFMFALFLTTKRAHIVLAILALVLVYLFSNASAKILKIIIAVSLGLALLLWLASFNEGVATAIQRIVESFQETGDLRELTSGRTLLWDAAISGWVLSPIFGLGWQSYHYVWPAGVTESFHAHNQVINLLYEAGVVGVAIYSVAALAALVVGVHALLIVQRDSTRPSWQRLGASFSVAMQLFMMMYANSTGELLHSAYAFIPYFAAVAISIAIHADVKRSNQKLGIL